MTGPKDQAEVHRELRFESAHYLPNVPEGHKCKRMHGHSFRVTVVVKGPIDPESGWVMDFAEVARACAPLVERLDHRLLNEIDGLENPTAENLARWLWKRLRPGLPLLAEIRVHETCTSSCTYRGPS